MNKFIEKNTRTLRRILTSKSSKQNDIDRKLNIIIQDLNLIFKYISEGIELHPKHASEKIVVVHHSEIQHSKGLLPCYYEHLERYEIAKKSILKMMKY